MKAAFIAKHKTIFMQRKENFQTADEKMQIYRLCAVIEEFGKGIAVTKYNPETKKNEVYRVEKGKDKKGNVVYAPLICK